MYLRRGGVCLRLSLYHFRIPDRPTVREKLRQESSWHTLGMIRFAYSSRSAMMKGHHAERDEYKRASRRSVVSTLGAAKQQTPGFAIRSVREIRGCVPKLDS